MRPYPAAAPIEPPEAYAPVAEPGRYPLRDVLVAARRVVATRRGSAKEHIAAMNALEDALDHCRHL
jgi:hypothetical protein